MGGLTSWALVLNQVKFIQGSNGLLIFANAVILIIVAWMIIEGISSFFSKRKDVAKS